MQFLCLVTLLMLSFIAEAAKDKKPKESLLEVVAKIKDPKKQLPEISGLEVSELHPGILWVLNDSGNSEEIFALDMEGNIVAQYEVLGAKNNDWEDMTLGPCPEQEGSCIYIADIGDAGNRKSDWRTIYVVKEPLEIKSQKLQAQSYTFKYDIGKPDSEAIAYYQGHLYIVTKAEKDLYRLPTLSQDMRLEKLCKFSTKGAITAIDIKDNVLLLRTYREILEYKDFLSCPKYSYKKTFDIERQGETIAYFGADFLTISEGLEPDIYLHKK